MSEIEAGQKWIGKKFRGVVEILGYSPTLREVWFYEESAGRSFTKEIDMFVRGYEKIEPFFEVGKRYERFFSDGSGSRFQPFDVREVGGLWYATGIKASFSEGATVSVGATVCTQTSISFEHYKEI